MWQHTCLLSSRNTRLTQGRVIVKPANDDEATALEPAPPAPPAPASAPEPTPVPAPANRLPALPAALAPLPPLPLLLNPVRDATNPYSSGRRFPAPIGIPSATFSSCSRNDLSRGCPLCPTWKQTETNPKKKETNGKEEKSRTRRRRSPLSTAKIDSKIKTKVQWSTQVQ